MISLYPINFYQELGGYNTQALQASQAYQQHFLLQQMQQQAFGLKVREIYLSNTKGD